MKQLSNENALVDLLERSVPMTNCGVIKMKVPPAYIRKLRAVPQYPRMRQMQIKIQREDLHIYGSEPDTYIRKQFALVDSTNHEVFFASNMKDDYGAPFKASSGEWADAENELWERIRSNGNRKAVCASAEFSLYPPAFEPFNINKFVGVLKTLSTVDAGRTNFGHSTTHFGRAAATFPWQVVDEMLYSFDYLHFGAGKVWYATSVSDYEKVVSALRTLYPEEYVYCTNAHVHKEFFVHPRLLEEKFGVKIFKTVQRAGE
ncbi:Transcription factor jumonji/aspartyl beta-hydroxylase, partial [Aphelenchoides avenae]